MRRGTLRNCAWTLAAFGVAVALSACGSSEDPNTIGQNPDPGQPGDPSTPAPPTAEEQVQKILDQRKTDYGEALRTASLKLRDRLPTLDEIKQIEGAADENAKKAAYEKLIDAMLESPEFSTTMIKFWQDTFRTGQVGQIRNGNPDKSAAAVFAAEVTVKGRPYADLFTATDNTCPTYGVDPNLDPADPNADVKDFRDGSCNTNPTAGVLTDPGLLSQYFANMAFRRTRFIQETFACQKFPVEYSTTPQPMGNGTYTNPWDFNSITGKQNTPDARVDFQDTSAVICANCHGTMNHIAPMFINYDDKGALQDSPQVLVPIPGNPKAKLEDYLQPGQTFAWRVDKPVKDIPELGKAMAADPVVAKCAVDRVWNYAMSRGDIVNDLASVPAEVTAPFVANFQKGGMVLKEVIRAVFKGEDFTKF